MLGKPNTLDLRPFALHVPIRLFRVRPLLRESGAVVRKDIVHGFVNVHCLTRVVPREDSLSSLGDEGFLCS